MCIRDSRYSIDDDDRRLAKQRSPGGLNEPPSVDFPAFQLDELGFRKLPASSLNPGFNSPIRQQGLRALDQQSRAVDRVHLSKDASGLLATPVAE